MKIAICGSGPLGIEMAMSLDEVGAEVTILGKHPKLGGMARRMTAIDPHFSMERPWHQITSPLGWKLLKKSPSSLEMDREIPTVKDYWEQYLSPLAEGPRIRTLYRQREAHRVHKCFLGLDEDIPNKSRRYDLFRVATFSLGPTLETFMDVDIVIDARGIFHNPFPLGPSHSLALNEGYINDDSTIFYGAQSLEKWKDVAQYEENKNKHIVLVGPGMIAALWIIKLAPWIKASKGKDKGNHLTLVTPESTPFEKLRREKNKRHILERLDRVLKEIREDEEVQYREFERENHKWRQQEDYMRVKCPPPPRPIPLIQTIPASNVISIDRFEEEGPKKMFVTIEKAPFRPPAPLLSPRRLSSSLKTLSADFLIVATGHFIDTDFSKGLRTKYHFTRKGAEDLFGRHPEPGFYTLGPLAYPGHKRYDLATGMAQIGPIRDDILSFFSEKKKEGGI